MAVGRVCVFALSLTLIVGQSGELQATTAHKILSPSTTKSKNATGNFQDSEAENLLKDIQSSPNTTATPPIETPSPPESASGRARDPPRRKKMDDGIVQMQYPTVETQPEEAAPPSGSRRKLRHGRGNEGNLEMQDSSNPRRRIEKQEPPNLHASDDHQDVMRFGFIVVIAGWASLVHYLNNKKGGGSSVMIAQWIDWLEKAVSTSNSTTTTNPNGSNPDGRRRIGV